MSENNVNRRDFFKTASVVGSTLTLANSLFAARPSKTGRVIGANDKINIGVIGCGGRGSYVATEFDKIGKADNSAQIVGVCDVYEKRKRANAEKYKVPGYVDYRELLNRDDVDAVIVATPDHWHATIALDAMDRGKDVYLEKPMCHTLEETHKLVTTVKETGRVLQVGSQTTSADQWWKARKVITDGMLGRMLFSQGSYHRNSIEGEWNWPIDADAGPDASGENHIDWNTWLGPAPKRKYDADRYFRFRKYWDYSGGIATDLFFHVAAPMQICWGEPQYPAKVMAGGGIYEFKDEREVPDTFYLSGDYGKGHSIVLSSCMANSQHIPGLIRGHGATLTMVEHGMFERYSPYITVKAEKQDGKYIVPELEEKFKGETEIKIPVEDNGMMQAHVRNFLSCIRSRQKPTLDVETAAHAQVLITLGVQSYRQGKVMYFDEKNFKISDKPVKA